MTNTTTKAKKHLSHYSSSNIVRLLIYWQLHDFDLIKITEKQIWKYGKIEMAEKHIFISVYDIQEMAEELKK